MWCNSLGVEDLYINNLYEDFKDGIALLKILDKVKPESVDWKKVEKKPNNKFKKLANTKMCVDVCKDKYNFKMVNIGGVDIHNGEKKLVLATMWLIVTYHTLNVFFLFQMIGDKTEDQVLEWANGRVDASLKVSSFKDKAIGNSEWLFGLLRSVDKDCVDEEIIMKD